MKHREQQHVLEYLREENLVLREQLGKKRLRLTDDQRRRLAAKSHAVGRRLLGRFGSIVTPDTILPWHRHLIAAKWTYASAKTGRPPLSKETEDLIVRMVRDNPTWGYRRIQGALANLGKGLAHNSVKRVLKDHGIEPAPAGCVVGAVTRTPAQQAGIAAKRWSFREVSWRAGLGGFFLSWYPGCVWRIALAPSGPRGAGPHDQHRMNEAPPRTGLGVPDWFSGATAEAGSVSRVLLVGLR